jgi:hypothetical protein
MKKTVLLFISLLTLVACKDDSSSNEDAQAIEYNVQGNEYAVAIVKTQGMSDSDAKQLALKRAAQMTQKHNYRYFSVEKEEDVQAMSSSGNNSQMPSNMYYELIQSGNFSREQFQDYNSSQTQLYPAYRITFKCYQEKPSGKAIDSCNLVECKK